MVGCWVAAGLVWSGAVVLCWHLQVSDHRVSHCFYVQWPLWPRPPWSAWTASLVSASLGSSRAFVCFLHTLLQGIGFCEKAQGSSLRHCYSAHMSPITPTPNWIWSFALECSHPAWFCGYKNSSSSAPESSLNLFDICPPLTPETLSLREELEYLHLITCPTLIFLGSAPQQLEESFLFLLDGVIPYIVSSFFSVLGLK